MIYCYFICYQALAEQSYGDFCGPTCDGVSGSQVAVPDPSSCTRYYTCTEVNGGYQIKSNGIFNLLLKYIFKRVITLILMVVFFSDFQVK